MHRAQAIREFCKECMCFGKTGDIDTDGKRWGNRSYKMIRECASVNCHLYTHRLSGGYDKEVKKRSRMKTLQNVQRHPRQLGQLFSKKFAIRNHCLECTGYQEAETRQCTDAECPLYPFRCV